MAVSPEVLEMLRLDSSDTWVLRLVPKNQEGHKTSNAEIITTSSKYTVAANCTSLTGACRVYARILRLRISLSSWSGTATSQLTTAQYRCRKHWLLAEGAGRVFNFFFFLMSQKKTEEYWTLKYWTCDTSDLSDSSPLPSPCMVSHMSELEMSFLTDKPTL